MASSFDSPDTVQLKGKSTGITRLSRKAKALVLLAITAIVGFILFSIMTMDSGDKPTSAADEPDTTAEKKAAPTVEPATPNLRGIGDGQVGVVAASDAAGLGGPSVAVGASGAGGVGGVGVPPVDGLASSPNSAHAPLRSTPAGGQTPAVQLSNQHNVGPQGEQYQTPEEAAAARAKQELVDKRNKAIGAGMEMGGGDGGLASLGGMGATAVPAIGANNQLNSALAAAAQAAQAAQAAGAGNPVAAYGQPQDDQNKQVRKESFLKSSQASQDNTVLKELVQPALSAYQLMGGSIIPAALECGLNSDLPGQTCARVIENVYDSATGRYLLIPQGTKILGTYDSQVAYGQERILVVWNRLIFPDGSSISIQGMPGEDKAGNAGFDADVNNHYAKVFGSALLMAAFSAGISLSQKQSTNAYGTLSNSQTVTQAVGQQLGQTGEAYITKGMNIQPTLTRAPGYRFNIVATKDIVFPSAYVPNPTRAAQ
ncbi:TrbI/VirB10 family protein [Paraburkholderia sacchari]|uniref:TrbI/VirB10 family protein n=1 Tax=Paraburkholderia sacchari TaxID=159450 RepID=A0A8T6ZRQ2_9BURK|nr:TrbI/VirB10 family protein [Paraburkholderia sacchari]NLP65504.1 TrbI/VirB10 family protein [Paraburkholderia sacchari]NLP65589.1 TrbI/VirB10 family protein [Paraburkholderia sacchari]